MHRDAGERPGLRLGLSSTCSSADAQLPVVSVDVCRLQQECQLVAADPPAFLVKAAESLGRDVVLVFAKKKLRPLVEKRSMPWDPIETIIDGLDTKQVWCSERPCDAQSGRWRASAIACLYIRA